MEKHFVITIKERGQERPIETEYIGNIDVRGLIEFYGLKEPDVEWYRIKEMIHSENF